MLMLVSCTDLLEPDLSNDLVVLNTPLDNDSLQSFTVNFWWDELEGVQEYRLQIVEGDFDLPIALSLDTIISNNVFDFVFTPGRYSWRIKGMNNSTETKFTSRDFTILPNQDLNQEQIILNLPQDNSFLNSSNVNLSWFLNSKADDYLVDVKENGSLILPTFVVAIDNQDVSLIEGIYSWTVQGRLGPERPAQRRGRRGPGARGCHALPTRLGHHRLSLTSHAIKNHHDLCALEGTR